MNRDYEILTLAALLHDVGKFVERAGETKYGEPPTSFDELYSHAWFSRKFLSEFFGWCEEKDTNGTDLTDLASFHHNPESVYDWILAEADRQASGHDRADGGEEELLERKHYNQYGKERVPLYPITERASLILFKDNKKFTVEKTEKVNSFYKLKRMSSGELFSTKKEAYLAEDFKNSYPAHFQDFKKSLTNFVFSAQKEKSILKFKKSVETLLKEYFWCIPQDTRLHAMPDVSLYDHMRLTAMLAGALFHYHNSTNTMTIEDVRNRTDQKYLLFAGDISGIQNFIYDVDSKGAYKALKGRSFFMQILPVIIAKRILDKLEMDETQIIYANGGHFYMILPNIQKVKEIIIEETEHINYELLKEFDGSVFLRSGHKAFNPELLQNKADNTILDKNNFCALWDDVQRTLAESDRHKYSKISRQHFSEIFGPAEHISEKDRKKNENERNKFFEEIGRTLKTANYLSIHKSDSKSHKILGYSFNMIEKIDDYGDLYVLDPKKLDEVFKSEKPRNITLFPTGGLKGFGENTFDEIAAEAKGSHLLGILRMDVDNLGKIFAKGLRNYRHELNYAREDFQVMGNMSKFNFYSIGRVTTLSSQLSMFFSSILSNIIDKNENFAEKAIIVYSGGDDLFILGQWHIIPEIAITIKKEFERFVCNNPAFSLSGGIALVPGKYPIYKAAELAGEAEEQAKSYKRNEKEKNAISFMGRAFDWDEIEDLQNKVAEIAEIPNSKPIINRINLIASSYETTKDEIKRIMAKPIDKEKVLQMAEAEKWRWQMVYSLSRLMKQHKEYDESAVKKIENIQKYFTEKVLKIGRTGIENAEILGIWLSNITRKMEKK
ncbi:MAG TPA: type III-A CRISPR-associated protein Cas10/Csm1 [bacterium]|nr:type III-A CRISPR-associated protein Cas10/Csm1 [bacterium]